MCLIQSLKESVRDLFAKVVFCLQSLWNTLWPSHSSPHSAPGLFVKMSVETLAQRHKKEMKELQVKAAAMKKSAPVSDKKRRKEILAEIEKLEKELQDRHAAELQSVSEEADSPAEEVNTSIKHSNALLNDDHANQAINGSNTLSNGDDVNQPIKHLNALSSSDDTDQSIKHSNALSNGDDEIPLSETAEINAVDGNSHSPAAESDNEEDGRPKLTRAQRRRVNKQAKMTQRFGELKIDDAKPVQISARTTEKIKLKKILDENNLKLVEVRSDGNCLYHSLVHQLFLNGKKISVLELRQKTAEYMKNHPDFFKPFLVHQETGNLFTENDFEKYLDDIVQTNVWGSQIELRAISAELKFPIRVLQAEGKNVLIGEEFLNEKNTFLTIVYHRHELSLGEHYNSVTPL